MSYADCTGFMLLRIDLPDSYENAIVDTQVVKQQKQTQEAIKNATIIKAEIEVVRSQYMKDIAVINAEAQYNATVTRNTAQAITLKNTITYQGWAFTASKSTIGI